MKRSDQNYRGKDRASVTSKTSSKSSPAVDRKKKPKATKTKQNEPTPKQKEKLVADKIKRQQLAMRPIESENKIFSNVIQSLEPNTVSTQTQEVEKSPNLKKKKVQRKIPVQPHKNATKPDNLNSTCHAEGSKIGKTLQGDAAEAYSDQKFVLETTEKSDSKQRKHKPHSPMKFSLNKTALKSKSETLNQKSSRTLRKPKNYNLNLGSMTQVSVLSTSTIENVSQRSTSKNSHVSDEEADINLVVAKLMEKNPNSMLKIIKKLLETTAVKGSENLHILEQFNDDEKSLVTLKSDHRPKTTTEKIRPQISYQNSKGKNDTKNVETSKSEVIKNMAPKPIKPRPASATKKVHKKADPKDIPNIRTDKKVVIDKPKKGTFTIPVDKKSSKTETFKAPIETKVNDISETKPESEASSDDPITKLEKLVNGDTKIPQRPSTCVESSNRNEIFFLARNSSLHNVPTSTNENSSKFNTFRKDKIIDWFNIGEEENEQIRNGMLRSVAIEPSPSLMNRNVGVKCDTTVKTSKPTSGTGKMAYSRKIKNTIMQNELNVNFKFR